MKLLEYKFITSFQNRNSCLALFNKKRNYLQDGRVRSTKRVFEKAQASSGPGFFPGRASIYAVEGTTGVYSAFVAGAGLCRVI